MKKDGDKMNDLVIEMTHGEGKITVVIIERGKGEKMENFKDEKKAIDFVIRYFGRGVKGE